MESEGEMRLDKWLWCARIFKTRREAAEACRLGRVTLNGKPARASRAIHCGDLVEARTSTYDRKFRVSGLVAGRVGAKRVPELLEDLTPKEEYERGRKSAIERILGRPAGSGRPTKRERREIDRLIG
jgi:ribosome-associated heat shock protein Hsp15